MNTEEKVNVTVQLDSDLLTRVDDRAEELDLNRSQYFRRLVRRDLGMTQMNLPIEAPLPASEEKVAA